MNEKIRQNLIQYNETINYSIDNESLIETLTQLKIIWKGDRESHRWWDLVDYVVELDGMYIKYTWAEANRDESVKELGWDFDEGSIYEVVPQEIKNIIYVPIN